MKPEDAHPGRHRRSVWKWLLAAGFLFAVVILLAPHVTRRSRAGPENKFIDAIHNMKDIGLALTEFKADYGSLPNDLTRTEVLRRHPECKIQLGTSSSNDYFHQLLASGIVNSPICFHGYGISKRKALEIPAA